MADERISEPHLVMKFKKQRRDTSNANMKTLERGETLKKVDENYFNRHFAHTP